MQAKIIGVALASLSLLAATAGDCRAETILFESGTLGETGISSAELIDGSPPSTSVDSTVYVGVKFRLEHPAITEKLGGHFVSPANETFFGAIVELNGEDDFPNSDDFSTPDFLGATSLEFPTASDEVFGNLSLSLDPGWYALVFGSGLFGADGDGSAIRNGLDIGSPTYIVAQPSTGGPGWVDVTFSRPNHRFVLKGQLVPEASTIALATVATILVFIISKSKKLGDKWTNN